MKQSHLKGALAAILSSLITLSAQAGPIIGPISGLGTWETTLQGRDLDGNAATFEAYYDTALDITWLADANINGKDTWQNQKNWAASLTLGGFTDWRLPTNTPVNGSTYNNAKRNNGTTDNGSAPTTTDGTDGGYRDGAGNPVSEMGNMFYVTLGNLGLCAPNGGGSTTSCIAPPDHSGISNTADFLNIQSSNYWSGSDRGANSGWSFSPGNGRQKGANKTASYFAWAVRDGDVISTVPEPATMTLLALGGLALCTRRRRIFGNRRI